MNKEWLDRIEDIVLTIVLLIAILLIVMHWR